LRLVINQRLSGSAWKLSGVWEFFQQQYNALGKTFCLEQELMHGDIGAAATM